MPRRRAAPLMEHRGGKVGEGTRREKTSEQKAELKGGRRVGKRRGGREVERRRKREGIKNRRSFISWKTFRLWMDLFDRPAAAIT